LPQQVTPEGNAKNGVTVDMVAFKLKVKACSRTVLDELYKAGVFFRPLHKKPILIKEDIKTRMKFSVEFKARRPAVWENQPNAITDNKLHPLYRNAAGRAEGARRQVRGAYRERGEGPKSWMVKANPTMKFPAQGVQVTAAVINCKIRVWRYVGGRWNATEAVKMYTGDLLKALKRNFPHQKTFCVLEDNDPASYKSKAALAAKSSVGIKTVNLPPRSPDLNVLAYSLWHTVNVAMRKQEAAMGAKSRDASLLLTTRPGLPCGNVSTTEDCDEGCAMHAPPGQPPPCRQGHPIH